MKLTWNENKTVVTDENGNMATVVYWGSCERAEASLGTLTNCHNCHNCHDCSCCSGCSRCSDCSECSECVRCSGCSRCSCCSYCSGCSECVVSGKLGAYNYWVCGDMATVGCETHSIDTWLQFTLEDIAPMAPDAGAWYDSYWAVWTELVKAGRGKGTYKPKTK